MIVLNTELTAAIRAEGERAYPNECCGVLLGVVDDEGKKRVSDTIPVENAREAGEQYHRFRIEAEDLMKAELAARRRGWEVLGFYHSHPDHPARPSDYDREYALPFYSYVIVAVERGRSAELTSWELATNRGQFNAEMVASAEA